MNQKAQSSNSMADSNNSGKKLTKASPKPENAIAAGAFAQSRGPWPGWFWLGALLSGLLGLSVGLGYVDLGEVKTPFGQAIVLVPYIAAIATIGLSLLGAWALGRRANTDASVRLVFRAQGEDGSPLMITTLAGDSVYANRAFRDLFRRDLFGRDVETGKTVPNVLSDLSLADDDDVSGEKLDHLLAQASSGAEDWEEIEIWRNFGGKLLIQRWRLGARPLSGRGEKLIAWTARDVTAAYEMEITRKREGDLLSDLLDNLPVGFFSVNGNGEIVFANEVLCSWLGVSLAEMKSGRVSFADFVIASGSFGPSNENNEGQDETDDGLNGEVTLQAHDGTTFRAFLFQSGRLNNDGDLLYTRSVVVRDNPGRRRKTEEGRMDAREIARKLYWLFDEAPVSIILLDLQGNVTDCNRAIQRMLGIHRDAIISRPFTDLLAKEDTGDVAAQLSKVVMGISRAAHLEVRMPASGGREVMASLYASRMEDAFGEVTGLVIHFIDTTEQKHLEIQFAQSQKMQAIGQLAGGIAHDFNNLLTAMIGFSDLLLARHGPDDPSFADIQQIKQNANRATNLVRQLLTFSRKDSLELVVFDPNEALSDLSSMLGRLLESPIELNMENEPELGMVKMDRNQFDQVIINLAVNAKDAMRRGGQLTVRTANLNLEKPMQRGMDLVPAGEFVTIDVIDTGIGIRKEDMGRIFEPFFSTKEVGEGTGLGLSTVYGIVHQAGGYVFVDSAPGEGTTFTVLLPCHVSKSERRPRAVDGIGTQSLQGESASMLTADLTGVGTILLVEDEDAVRMFATRALKNKGYEVLEAANGEVALDVINSTDAHIDLIVTDVVMPGMDGHTLVQFVRQEMPDVKVIFISGYTDNVIPGGFGKGDYSFLPKPFSLKDLASKVKEVLEK
ncbi:MAG: PAS domain-containing protein [Rhodospirillaceae bacterium]|nr:PAS domain-containing protein [Rhodospirillaceae bacterium]